MHSRSRIFCNHPWQRGYTLTEATAAGAILALLACLALPSFNGLIARQRLAGLAAQVATDIQFTRSASVWRNEPLRLSFYSPAGSSCYVVHTGNRQQCTCAADTGTALCTGDAAALKAVAVPASTGLAVQANVNSMLFDPLHGTSTPAGTLRVVSAAGSIHHIVNVLGRVRTCTPGNATALSGYTAC